MERAKLALGRALLARGDGLAQEIIWDRDEEGTLVSLARELHVPKSAIKVVHRSDLGRRRNRARGEGRLMVQGCEITEGLGDGAKAGRNPLRREPTERRQLYREVLEVLVLVGFVVPRLAGRLARVRETIRLLFRDGSEAGACTRRRTSHLTASITVATALGAAELACGRGSTE